MTWPQGCKKIETNEQLTKILNDDNYWGEDKEDGIRVVVKYGPDGLPRITTRGKVLNGPEEPIDITHRVPSIARLKIPKLSGTEFDGELMKDGYTAAKLAGIVNYRSTVPIPEGIYMLVFDVLATAGKDLRRQPLESRRYILEEYRRVLEKVSCYRFKSPVVGARNKLNRLAEILSSGGEGMVFKNKNSHYTEGKKPANAWYKYKKKDTTDAVIVGYKEASMYYTDPDTGKPDLTRHTRNYANGWIGSLEVEFKAKNGVMVRGYTAGLTDELLAMFSNHGQLKAEFIGRKCEVEFMEPTEHSKLRHPRFIRLREEIEK